MNNPKEFGLSHLLYLLVSIIVFVLLMIFIKKKVKTEKALNITIKILGGLLLASILFNRISVSYLKDGFKFFLPSSYCGLSSIALGIVAIFGKKDNIFLHSIGYTGLLGGIMTLIYPDFIGQGSTIFYPMTISGLLHHTITVYIVVIMLMTGYLKPDIKKWHILPIGLSFYVMYGTFLIHVIGYSNSMYIVNPILEGTIFYWYVIGIIFLVVHYIFLYVWDKTLKEKVIIDIIK